MLIMAKLICKRTKNIKGKHGKLKGVTVKRCADYGVKGKVRGGVYGGHHKNKPKRRHS